LENRYHIKKHIIGQILHFLAKLSFIGGDEMKSIRYVGWEERVYEFARKKKLVTYGGRAMNINVSKIPLLRRYTSDYDLWSKSPKTTSEELTRKLGPHYYAKRIQIPSTKKFLYRIYHQSGLLTADVTRVPPRESYHLVGGQYYQTLMHQRERLEQILSDPSKKFRHAKARMDLRKINYYLKEMEKR
jgi:hypothetical protein